MSIQGSPMTVGLRSRSPRRVTSRRLPEQTAATSDATSSAVLFGAPSSFACALGPHSPTASSCPGEVELAPPAHRDGLAVPQRWRIRAARDVPLDRLERAGRRLARHAHVAHPAVRADEIDRAHDAGDGLPLRNAGAAPLA